MNIIVTGLRKTDPVANAEIFAGLCYNELNFFPSIGRVKRLNKPISNKQQPLLVTLDCVESVRQILRMARKLRQSTVHYTRLSISINDDLSLSKDEAKSLIRKGVVDDRIDRIVKPNNRLQELSYRFWSDQPD